MPKCQLGCKCGKHFISEDHMKALSKALKGKPKTDEHKKKLSESLTGRVFTAEWIAKMSKPRTKTWSSEVREKHSQRMTGRTIYWKDKISKAHLSPETLAKTRATNLERYGRTDGPRVDTTPELLTKEFLRLQGVKIFSFDENGKIAFNNELSRPRAFEQCPAAGYLPDLYFPDIKLAVFVDGCFWHGCSLHGNNFWGRDKVRLHDIEVNKKLLSTEHKVFRIWEHDVMNGNFLDLAKKLADSF